MDYLELESERLLYRKYRQKDFSIFYDMLSSDENMKYRSSEPKNEQDVQKYIDWGITCAEQKPCINYRYAVVQKESGKLIGSCELAYTNKDPAELAWELHRSYWHKGYGSEIGRTLLKLGFEMLKLRRIIADCNTLNTGSYKIMEKIGMRREAHYIKCYQGNSVLNHQWCDKYLYALLRDEYLAFECQPQIEGANHKMNYEIIRLIDKPELLDRAAQWFHEKWHIPLSSYIESMEACLSNKTCIPQWYVVMENQRIIGGLGVIENDFHDRKDLTPNVCAVYTEKDKRCNGIAGALLNYVCTDMKEKGVNTLYLLTDHDSFYERYGWEFLCMVKGDEETELSRMYIHRA